MCLKRASSGFEVTSAGLVKLRYNPKRQIVTCRWALPVLVVLLLTAIVVIIHCHLERHTTFLYA